MDSLIGATYVVLNAVSTYDWASTRITSRMKSKQTFDCMTWVALVGWVRSSRVIDLEWPLESDKINHFIPIFLEQCHFDDGRGDICR